MIHLSKINRFSNIYFENFYKSWRTYYRLVQLQSLKTQMSCDSKIKKQDQPKVQESSQSQRQSESESCSQFTTQNKLPYNRRQIYHQFKILPKPKERSYPVWDCVNYIKDQFDKIEQYGYDFSYTNKYNRQEMQNQENTIEKHRKIRRKVKLRFMCKGCPNKKWTSIVGTMEMKFIFVFSDQLLHYNYPYILKFRLKIYRMKCSDCEIYGLPSVYESQLKTFARSACITLVDILMKVPEPQFKDKRQKMTEVHNHQVELCEACQHGKCFAVPKAKVSPALALAFELVFQLL